MSVESSFLTVTRIGEVKQDKNGREYKTVYLKGEESKFLVRGGKLKEVKVFARESSTNAYAQSYLNDQPEAAWDLKVGDLVLGAIATRTVEPYEIPVVSTGEMREVNTYSRPIFGDTANPQEFEALVEREFKSQGREIVKMDQPAYANEAHALDS